MFSWIVDNSRSEEIEYVLCTLEAEVQIYGEGDMIETTKQAEDHLMYKDLYGDLVVAYNKLKEEEMGLVNLTFPGTVKLLEDLSIWIGDIVATMHIPHMLQEWCLTMVTNLKGNLSWLEMVRWKSPV